MGFLGKGKAQVKRNILMAGFLIAATAFFSLHTSQHCYAAVLQDITVAATDASTEVVLQLDERAPFKYDYLPLSATLPARCYIDLGNASRKQTLPSRLPVESQHVASIRTGHHATKLRVAIDLKHDAVCMVSSSTADPFQIRISIADESSLRAESPVSAKDGWSAAVLVPGLELATGPAGAEPAPAIALQATGTDSGAQHSLLVPAGRKELSTWGWAQLYSAYDIKNDQAEDDRLSRIQGRLGAGWNKQLSQGDSLKLAAAIDLDRFFYDADLADEDTDITLHETYLQYNRPDWDVAFGKQRVRWGKSDQLSPVDSLNPQDFRQFVTIDLEERALPSWLLRNRWHGESFGLETIVQPWFQESELEYFDSNWALYRNLRQTLIANPQLPAEVKDYVRNLRIDEDEPGKTLGNMSAAARVTWNTAQADFAVSYHYGWETLPTITDFPVKNISFSGDPDADPTQVLANAVFTDLRVQAEYKRQQTFGFEWETVLDPIGFRGEIAHIDHVAFLSADLTSKRRPVTHLVSGIDYTSANEWYFNLQGSWYHIHDYTRDILYFEDNTVSVLGEISKPVWRGNLKLGTKYNYTLTDQSSYLRPYATLTYFRNLECELGFTIFSGDGETLLGSYDYADQAYGRIKYSF